MKKTVVYAKRQLSHSRIEISPLAASQTALRLVRMALLISTTPEEQNACMRAFVSQANRVMDLSGWEAPE